MPKTVICPLCTKFPMDNLDVRLEMVAEEGLCPICEGTKEISLAEAESLLISARKWGIVPEWAA